ncbi:MAG: hypothetical protein AB8G14_06910 [Ilumatobacter sp.]
MEFAVDHRTPALSAPPSRPGVGQRSGSERADALRDVLAELGERVKPVVMARERTLPVAAPFAQVLPDDGLVRGRVMSCHGVADTSLAFGLIREALIGGAWAAVVDVSTFGADAASEFGIPLERVVRVETGVDAAERSAGVGNDAAWIDVMGAAVDGFDMVVTRVPAGLRGERRPAAVRKLIARIQQQGAVVVALGETGALSSDIVLTTDSTSWEGLGDGSGHLRARTIDVVASGRRLPAPRSASISVEGAVNGRGRVVLSVVSEAVDTPTGPVVVDVRDPQEELLAEMAAEMPADAVAPDTERRLAG